MAELTELQKQEELAKIVTDTKSMVDRHEKDSKDWMKTAEAKEMMARISVDVEALDEKQSKEKEDRIKAAAELGEYKETCTKTIEELKKMYAAKHRPDANNEKNYDATEREDLFYKTLVYGGLDHGLMTEKSNWELSREEINRYGDLVGADYKAMTTHNLARAGVMTVPATIVTETLDTAKQVLTNIRPYARNWRVATKEMEISLMTAHGVASAAYEEGTMSEDETAKFGSQSLHLHKYFHRYHLTHEMLKFGYPQLLPTLKTDSGVAFAKKLGTAHVIGTGAGEPEGVLVNSSIPTVNLEETTSITTGDYLSKGFYTLKETYADDARWLMKRLTLWELHILKGSDGHPLLVQLRDKPDFLFMGAPIIQSPDMPAVASAAKPIMLANFNELYGTIDFSGSTIKIQDPYTQKATGIVEYLTVMWFGGRVLIPEAGIIFVASIT